MAITISASTMGLSRTANLPSNTNFTASGWCQVISDVGANTLQPIYSHLSAGLDGLLFGWEGGGSELMGITCLLAGASSSTATFASRPATGTSFFWYVRCSGTGASQLEAGWRSMGSNTWVTAAATMSAAAAAPTLLQLGRVSANSTYANARHWSIKVWDRVLTDAELLIESSLRRVMFPSSINFHWPLRTASDTRDLSGNARVPTVNGTPTTSDDGYLAGPRRRIFFPATVVAAAASLVFPQGYFAVPPALRI